MSENEQPISPEEKLLKVIQEGGKEVAPNGEAESQEITGDGQPVVAPATSLGAEEPELAETLDVGVEDAEEIESPAVPGDAEPTERPRLKVARPETTDAGTADVAPPDKSEGSEGAAAAVAAGVAASAGDGQSGAPVSKGRFLSKKRRDPVQSISAVNKFLVVAVILLIFLTGFEIWDSVKTLAAEQSAKDPFGALEIADREEDLPPSPPSSGLPSVEMILKPFMARFLFAIPVKEKEDETEKPGPKAEIRSQLTLIGLSYVTDQGKTPEAIVMDNKINKMHFLMIGATVTVGQRLLTLEEIHPDRVVFTEGKNRITVECGKSNE